MRFHMLNSVRIINLGFQNIFLKQIEMGNRDVNIYKTKHT